MPKPLIDLRSDTVTKPTPGMRRAIADAEVGDDMVGEDPTVNRLEAMCAEMFDKEAAVYACSGTQSNQMAVRTHCRPGDELLINEAGHIANFEAGGPAVLSGVTVRTIPAPHGMLDDDELDGKIRRDDQHLCRTRLVCIENTTNMGGGRAWPLEQLERVSAWCRDSRLKLHMDGARLFNACVKRGYTAADVGRLVDTVSVCFSKGLGAPMGSILVGSAEDIAVARRSRKLFGGALRQAGIPAAAAIYALENHIDRMAEDHANARLLAEGIAEIDGLSIGPDDVETNLVFFEVDPELGTAAALIQKLLARGVRMGSTVAQRVRACTHLDVTRGDIERAIEALRETVEEDLHTPVGAAAGPYAQ
ncbi:MAG: aminotransferase class I/II-fold pyridoxal phosphate-dependent enzyme [Planctomycetes bacterium]|nr:aminotransferase class I/II-fold pyridoxal phosphate-dependent enzyme [Planctomycetota bacterium]